jgi:hypothetical protein
MLNSDHDDELLQTWEKLLISPILFDAHELLFVGSVSNRRQRVLSLWHSLKTELWGFMQPVLRTFRTA